MGSDAREMCSTVAEATQEAVLPMALETRYETIGQWRLPVLAVPRPTSVLSTSVRAPIGNAVANSAKAKQRTADWKRAVGGAVRAAGGTSRRDPRDHWAITMGFAFHPRLHGSGSFDVENFMKPTLDAIAAGLFAAVDVDVATIVAWKHDDSNFRHILVHRLPDVRADCEEGAAVFICGWSIR